MTVETLTRYRIHYQRGSELRYVGNLDMQLGWERTLRRARLPVAFSQGFNPRPRFHMASALPLGFTSNCEIFDLWLNHALDAQEVASKLQHSAPPGLLIDDAAVIPLNLPALQTLVSAAEYRAIVREMPPDLDLARAVSEILAAAELPRVWRSKPYNLRPLIFALQMDAPEGGWPVLVMRLSAREGATGRPEEVLSALGLDPTAARVTRVQLVLNETHNEL